MVPLPVASVVLTVVLHASESTSGLLEPVVGVAIGVLIVTLYLAVLRYVGRRSRERLS
jgi:type II secretory pathway component PulF